MPFTQPRIPQPTRIFKPRPKITRQTPWRLPRRFRPSDRRPWRPGDGSIFLAWVHFPRILWSRTRRGWRT